VVGGSVLIAGLAIKSLSKTDHHNNNNDSNRSNSNSRKKIHAHSQQQQQQQQRVRLSRQNSGSDMRELAMRRRYSYTALDIEAGIDCCSGSNSSSIVSSRNAVLRV
jgi:hypothetical protein